MASPDDKKISQLPDNPVVLDTDEFSSITPRTDGTIGFENVKTPAWKLKDYVNTDPHVKGQATFEAGTRSKPSIAHEGDTDTGIHFPTIDTLSLGTAGVETITIDPHNNTILGPLDLVDQTSRDGFVYLPTMNGSPMALPRQIANKTPLIIDTLNNVAFIFANGAWRPLSSGSTPGGAGIVIPTPVTRLDALDDVSATGASRPANGDALVWDAASSKWKPAHPGIEVTQRPDRRTSYPNPATLPAGHLILTEENGAKEIAVVDASHRIQVLYSDAELAAKIAASSLFQGVKPDLAALATLPAPAPTNKGFYWTWTGPASTPIAPANFPNGGGFTDTLQVGDWIQSDGTKFVHVPSDLMSKLRWKAVGSFQTWTDTNYELDTLVVHNGRFYRATAAVTTGTPSPDVGGPWLDITPNYRVDDLINVDMTTPASVDDVLKFDGVSWVPGSPIPAANADGDILIWDDSIKQWMPVSDRLQDKSDVTIDAASDGASPIWDAANHAFTVKKVNLDQLADTADLSGAADGEVPMWDDANAKWIPGLPASALADLSDVTIPNPPQAGSTLSWDANLGKWTPVPYHPIDEFDPNVYYNKGDIVISNDGIWRARQEGKLPEPTRPQLAAYLLIKMPGYSPEEIFQVTTVSAAPPDATTDVSSSVSHKFHLEYHDDDNWKVYAYDKVAKTWHELVGRHVTWRSVGEPPDPSINGQVTLWIRAQKTNRSKPIAAPPEWEHFRVSTSLAALEDVMLTDETPGQTLVMAADGRWHAGSAPAHIPEWTPGSRQYVAGDVTHFEGRFWRSNTNGNNLAKPEIAMGAASVIWDNGGQRVAVVRTISPTVLTTVPIGLMDTYIRYVSDTDWDLYVASVNATTHAFEWKLATGPKSVWRHVALPSPGAAPYVTLWVYSLPGSTTAPVVGQQDWTPILLGDFLVSLSDVSAPNPAKDDLLQFNGSGKWVAGPSQSYLKSEVDAKISALITGLSHAEAIQNILTAPPPVTLIDEWYIVAAGATGAWAGQDNKVARWDGTAWQFTAPVVGEAHLNLADAATYSWSASANKWVPVLNTSLQWPPGGTDGMVLKKKGGAAEWDSMTLRQLADVSIPAPLDGQAIVWDASLGKWLAKTLTAGTGGAVTPGAPTANPVTISETPPSSPAPKAGDLWWNDATGVLYIYYTDANSSQWVSVTSALTTSVAIASAGSTGAGAGTSTGVGLPTGGAAGDVLTIVGGIPKWTPPPTAPTNYYTKAEEDQKFANIYTKSETNVEIAKLYSRAEVDALIASTLKAVTLTKAQYAALATKDASTIYLVTP